MMVLFREDEIRIKKQEKAEKLAKRTKFGFWVRRFAKIAVVIAIFFLVSLGLLAGLGGSHDALKKGIEDYLTQSTGLQAKIGEFKGLEFFPNVKLDAAQITLRKGGEGAPLVTISTVKFSAGFFDLMFSRRRIKALDIENIYVAPGLLGDKELVIDRISLAEKGADKDPALIVDGHYGEQKIVFDMMMEKKEGVFRVPKNGGLNVSFGDFEAQGTTESVQWGGTLFHVSSLGLPENALSGDVIIKKYFSGKHIKADLKFGDSQIRAALKMSPKYLKGTINFPSFNPGDIEILTRLYGFLNNLPSKKHAGLIDFYGWVVDLDITAEELRGAKEDLGDLHLNIALKDQIVRASLKGSFSGGDLNAVFDLDAASLPATLKIQATLENWDYGQYQKAMFGRKNASGTANININLHAKGKTYADLRGALDGEAVLIAGKGKMTSAAFNIWGGGLVNALLPGLDNDSETTLNCMIADFKIKGGIAKTDPLFVDTKRVTVRGEGTVNLLDNKIDIKLNPNAKDPAFLDVATSINIKGSILNPSISADTVSLLGKIGGLALGIVNPAFLVFSMTDMGITEEHPCYKFIRHTKEEKQAEEKKKKGRDVPEFNE